MQDVIGKCGEFWPQGKLAPEIRVERHGQEKADDNTEDPGPDDSTKRNNIASTDEEVESVSTEKEGDLRTMNDSGKSQDGKSALISQPDNLSSTRTLRIRQKTTQGHSSYSILASPGLSVRMTYILIPKAKKLGKVREA